MNSLFNKMDTLRGVCVVEWGKEPSNIMLGKKKNCNFFSSLQLLHVPKFGGIKEGGALSLRRSSSITGRTQ